MHAPGPWTYTHPAPHIWNIRDAHGSLIAVYHGANSDENPQNEDTARLLATAPQLYAALRTLVAADNVNYQRDTMRYEGLFDAGRDALTAASGETQAAHPDGSPIPGPPSGADYTPTESAPALRDMLDLLLRTVHDTLRHGLQPGQREALEDVARCAAALLRETPGSDCY